MTTVFSSEDAGCEVSSVSEIVGREAGNGIENVVNPVPDVAFDEARNHVCKAF